MSVLEKKRKGEREGIERECSYAVGFVTCSWGGTRLCRGGPCGWSIGCLNDAVIGNRLLF